MKKVNTIGIYACDQYYLVTPDKKIRQIEGAKGTEKAQFPNLIVGEKDMKRYTEIGARKLCQMILDFNSTHTVFSAESAFTREFDSDNESSDGSSEEDDYWDDEDFAGGLRK